LDYKTSIKGAPSTGSTDSSANSTTGSNGSFPTAQPTALPADGKGHVPTGVAATTGLTGAGNGSAGGNNGIRVGASGTVSSSDAGPAGRLTAGRSTGDTTAGGHHGVEDDRYTFGAEIVIGALISASAIAKGRAQADAVRTPIEVGNANLVTQQIIPAILSTSTSPAIKNDVGAKTDAIPPLTTTKVDSGSKVDGTTRVDAGSSATSSTKADAGAKGGGAVPLTGNPLSAQIKGSADLSVRTDRTEMPINKAEAAIHTESSPIGLSANRAEHLLAADRLSNPFESNTATSKKAPKGLAEMAMQNTWLPMVELVNAAIADAAAEEDSDSTDGSSAQHEDAILSKQAAAPLRRKHVVGPKDSLCGIAEQLFGDRRVAGLIADINRGRIKDATIQGQRVVELYVGQIVELPHSWEVDQYLQRRLYESTASEPITIVSNAAKNGELIESVLGKIV
jgi:hypothetical protein